MNSYGNYLATKYIMESNAKKKKTKQASKVSAFIALFIVIIILCYIIRVIINPMNFWNDLDYLLKAFDNWFLNI